MKVMIKKSIMIFVIPIILLSMSGCNPLAILSFVADVLSICSYVESHSSRTGKNITSVQVVKFSDDIITFGNFPKKNTGRSITNKKLSIDINDNEITQIDFLLNKVGEFGIKLTNYSALIPAVYLFSNFREDIDLCGEFDDKGHLIYKFKTDTDDETFSLLLSDKYYNQREVNFEIVQY